VAFVPVDGTPSMPVWLFALALSVVTGALFSAAPAWAMLRTPPLEALSGAGRSVHVRSFVPRGSLLMVQVALSLVLLSSAGLLATSLANLERQRLGFTPADRLVVRIDPPAIAGNIDRLSALFARLDDNLRRVPGVERVAYAMYSPMEGNNWSSGISIAGRRSDPNRPDSASWNRVSAGYFETVGTRVLRGRAIGDRDTPGGRHVAVVNEVSGSSTTRSSGRRWALAMRPVPFRDRQVVEDVVTPVPPQRAALVFPCSDGGARDPTAAIQARSTLPKALSCRRPAEGLEVSIHRPLPAWIPI
jgi:hypothetical protein